MPIQNAVLPYFYWILLRLNNNNYNENEFLPGYNIGNKKTANIKSVTTRHVNLFFLMD
jgi:hypothetical protein